MAVLETVKTHLMSPSRVDVFGLAVLTGLTMHHGFFIHGEWHLHAPAIVLGHTLVFTCLLLGSFYCGKSDINTFDQYSTVISIGYCTALFTSMAVYRLIFHRLTRAGFPGPICARVTKLWHVWACRRSQNHLVLAGLNQRYGDFVRTGKCRRSCTCPDVLINNPGPSEITVFHPDVFGAIDGPKTECIKSEWYDILHPNLSLVTSRDKFSHQTRRRQWNRGFSTKGW